MEDNLFRIVICIKPIRSELLSQDNNGFSEPFSLNPYEMLALQQFVKLKKTGETPFKITCVCMAHPSAESLMKKMLAMGSDEAVLVSDSQFSGSDTVATSYILSQAISKLENVKLVVCGLKTIDGETGQIPPALSERLGFQSVVSADELVAITKDTITYKRVCKDSLCTLQKDYPTVLTFRQFSTKPPVVNLLALKRSKNKEIPHWNGEDLGTDVSRCGLNGSKTKVLQIQNEIVKKDGQELEGTVDEKVEKIMGIIGIK